MKVTLLLAGLGRCSARRWPCPAWSRGKLNLAQISFQLLQQLIHAPAELRIETGKIILRPVLHLDVGINAVVLHLPTDVLEPERELRLSSHTPIDKRVPRPDPDDSAPGALADQRSQFHRLEVVTEDVAVRTGEFVGKRDHRPRGRIFRPWMNAEPTRLHVAQPSARELL